MPGLIGGIASIFAVSALAGQFDSNYFTAIANGGTKSDQVMAQVWMILVTLGTAIFTGYFGGLMAKKGIQAPEILFKDDDHFHDVVSKYPQSYIDMDKKDE
jgi:2-methylcitrate dehydratase PrpD